MTITTKYNIGDILQHKFNSNHKMKEFELHDFIVKFRVLEIIATSCYAGTQINYRLRPLVESKYSKEAKPKDLPVYTEPELELLEKAEVTP